MYSSTETHTWYLVPEYINSMYRQHFQQRMDQPVMIVNPASGKLNRENVLSLSPFAPENLISQKGSAIPAPASACLFSTRRLHLVLTHGIPPAFSDGVLFIHPANRHRVSPEFIGPRIYGPKAFTAQSPPAQGQKSSR